MTAPVPATPETPGPCQCHSSHAAVAPFHHGHCCFWPANRTCHAEDVAMWEKRRDWLNAETRKARNS